MRRWSPVSFGLAAALVVAAAVGAPTARSATAIDTVAAPAHVDAGSGHDDERNGDGHAADEGLTMVAGAHGPGGEPSTACADDQPVRSFDVVALDVDITVNRFLDHDPDGRMYALADDVARVRAEEAANAAARAGSGEPAVSLGLQGDAIQPLILRVQPGDCLRVSLRNDLTETTEGTPLASIDLHGAPWRLASGGPATLDDPRSFARPGDVVDYEWSIPADEPEGTHYFHSTGDERDQTSHGLFGALIVEPRGAQWTDPRTGEPARSGWDAIVQRSDGTAFREFAIVYHEIGDETYLLQDAQGEFVPIVDDTTDAYRPGSRALNYRSEPFRNRLLLGEQRTGVIDRSLAYSSYTYGDPATPILRTEMGDPTVQRVVHAGSEVHHVHHVHGGSIRWPRQPGAQDAAPIPGLEKNPPLTPEATARTDSQTIGPAETFDVYDECTAGGCQQSPGDFMYHCHIAHHYVAGMWGIWRVYNTTQSPGAQTDELPPLRSLPGLDDPVRPAVTSAELVGVTVTGTGDGVPLTAETLPTWVERTLPAAGSPKGYDASVWDWVWDGLIARGEPDTTEEWAGHRATGPPGRPAILFDPVSGKPAYPMLRPHLARRPPFARDHSPTPYLDPPDPSEPRPRPSDPGANGPSSLCPTGTALDPFAINAIRTSVAQNPELPIVDPNGMVFVLRGQRDAVEADPSLAGPLTIRANATEDCVDVLLRSEIDDNVDEPFAKVSLHIHHVQFDIQGSDGVTNGFNYEQSIRPYEAEGVALPRDVAAGDVVLPVPGAAARFSPDAAIGVGLDEDASFEEARIVSVGDDSVTLAAPLLHDHPAGAIVGTEYLRYRWYPDAQFGTAYFHDHVDAIHGWRHGMIGALIAEPPGSVYTDPFTGEEIDSGLIADITTDGDQSVDVSGSFREYAVHIQDDNPLSRGGRSSGSALDLRVEPLDRRGGDPAELFSSTVHGDPATPIFDAVLGDPLVFRSLVAATNDVHTLHIDGHWFRLEPWSAASRPVGTVRIGVSERYDLVVPAAGGPRLRTGDYLVRNGRIHKLEEGSWAILRVHEPTGPDGPRPLQGRAVPEPPPTLCPADAPRRELSVDVISVRLPMLGRRIGKIYVDRALADEVLAGTRAPEPYVAHASVGDCIEIDVRNRTDDGPVSIHADQLAYDPSTSGGVAVGGEPVQVVENGAARTFEFYASDEVGETVALIHDYADVTRNPSLGLYGAIVVGARGTRWLGEGPVVVGVPTDGPAYRDATLLFQDEDAGIGTHRMPYSSDLEEIRGLNYVAADGPPGPGAVSPAPEVVARTGDPVRMHVVMPVSEQAGVFSVEGHRWPVEPAMAGSTLVSATSIGALEALTLEFEAGPAGAGRYAYGMQRGAYREAGLWGWLDVRDDAPALPGAAASNVSATGPLAVVAGVLFALGLVVARRRFSRRVDS